MFVLPYLACNTITDNSILPWQLCLCCAYYSHLVVSLFKVVRFLQATRNLHFIYLSNIDIEPQENKIKLHNAVDYSLIIVNNVEYHVCLLLLLQTFTKSIELSGTHIRWLKIFSKILSNNIMQVDDGVYRLYFLSEYKFSITFVYNSCLVYSIAFHRP